MTQLNSNVAAALKAIVCGAAVFIITVIASSPVGAGTVAFMAPAGVVTDVQPNNPVNLGLFFTPSTSTSTSTPAPWLTRSTLSTLPGVRTTARTSYSQIRSRNPARSACSPSAWCWRGSCIFASPAFVIDGISTVDLASNGFGSLESPSWPLRSAIKPRSPKSGDSISPRTAYAIVSASINQLRRGGGCPHQGCGS